MKLTGACIAAAPIIAAASAIVAKIARAGRGERP